MECTQRLDYEFSQTQTERTERICPEQVGFLGILGTKHVIKKGPNKIGRDPQTCNIVLNLNSISRQHAVINVLNSHNFMLMDLDSANKTRLNNKCLSAYIPVPLCNGDTVQFGEVFGVFRLLEEDTELPCTQAIDVPDTPAPPAHTPAAHTAHRPRGRGRALVPESPDVSDKDDSFVVPSQPKPDRKFKSPVNKFLESVSRRYANHSTDSNKTSQLSWASSKKSDSFNFDDSNSLNDSTEVGDKIKKASLGKNESVNSLYTADTQPPPEHVPSIYSQETQLPQLNDNPKTVEQLDASKDDSIFSAETQPPPESGSSVKAKDDIFNADTQLPPQLVNNNRSIFEADTQLPYESPSEANNEAIFEAATQPPPPFSGSKSIHEMDTQLPLPVQNESPESVFSAETQFPPQNPSIYSQNTQLPETSNKDDIFDAETQPITNKSPNTSDDRKQTSRNKENTAVSNTEMKPPTTKNILNVDVAIGTSKDKSKDRFDKSDEVILFDELDSQSFVDDFSQPIIGDSAPTERDNEEIPLSQSDTITDDDFDVRLEAGTDPKPARKDARSKSDESTDCEDLEFLPTQKIPENPTNEDQLTDCEDDTDANLTSERTAPANGSKQFDDLPTQVIPPAPTASTSRIDFEDLATQVIPEVENRVKDDINESIDNINEERFEDMMTQVIPEENCNKETDIADLPTQVLADDVPKKIAAKQFAQYSEEVISPFKVPFQTPMKSKKKDIPKINLDTDRAKSVSPSVKTKSTNDEEKYYAATQEILDDLCSQTDADYNQSEPSNNNVVNILADEKARPEYRSSGNVDLDGEIEITVNRKKKSSGDGEKTDNVLIKNNKGTSGADVAAPRRAPSDPADGDVTPTKVRPGRFLATLLPDSQEIKTGVGLVPAAADTDSSSESEQEKHSQEPTPIAFHRKRRGRADVKVDLTSKFDVSELPTRVLTRTRRPTVKVQENCDAATRKSGRNILRPKYLHDSEQDGEIDSDIISENITRLKSKVDKKNHKEDSRSKKDEDRKSDEENLSKSIPTLIEDRKGKGESDGRDVVVDLTGVDDGERKTRRKNESSKYKKDNTASDGKLGRKKMESKELDVTEVKVTRSIGRSKKNVQEKITSYTVSGDDSKHKTSVGRVDESLNTTEDKDTSTRSARKIEKSKEIAIEKTEIELTKRKRGRPKKGENDSRKSDEINNDSKKEKSRKDPKTDKSSPPVKKNDKTDDTERDTNKGTKRQKKETEEPTEQIRRSKRQRTTKESQDSATHERSAVYNVSSGSSVDSPKRKMEGGEGAPRAKRTRTQAHTAHSVTTAAHSAPTTAHNSDGAVRVLFTAFPSEEVKAKLEKLGAVVVDSVRACSVVLTLQLRRTFKLLCAVGLGRPIAGPAWVQACVDTNALVDPWQYLLEDRASEARFGFSLQRTLRGPRGYLRGVHVTATPAVQPGPHEMQQIVECSGGSWGAPPGGGGRVSGGGGLWVAVTCAADRSLHAGLRARGATLVTSELVLSGVLKQRLDLHNYTIK